MAREIKDHELASPVDLPDEPLVEPAPLRWTATVIAVASVVLLFANAGTLAAWVDEKPVTEMQQRGSAVAAQWKQAMDGLGVTAPREKLHAIWKAAQATRFGDEAPGGTQ